jgi:cell division protein FtsQ
MMTVPSGSAPGEQPAIDPRIRQRRVAIRRSEGRRRLVWMAALVVVLVVAGGGWALLHTRWFSAQVVAVQGMHPHTTDAAIEAAAGLNRHPALVSADPGAMAHRIEALPFIATARVGRQWPDGMSVAVTERIPTLVMAGPGTSWSVLDGTGRTLQVTAAKPAGLVTTVVHTANGVVPPPPAGHSLPRAAATALRVGRTLPAAFSAQVTSLTAAPDGTLSLTLNSGITVLLGTDADLAAKYEDVAAIIAHGSLLGAKVIDVSVPQSPTVGA